MSTYPPQDSARSCVKDPRFVGARISAIEPGSPFDDAGFEPGCFVVSVDGRALRDIIDWRWLSADDEIEVGYIDLDGDGGSLTLVRDEGESWGVAFDGAVFDGVRRCRNACTFCFMRQLPQGLRESLYVRDDDYRLSFLSGTFITFTNVEQDDEARICEQRISPLRFSLHAVSADVRRRLIGRRAAHGLAVADRLLAAGIEMHAQIVLVPGENDGVELRRTLSWAYERPGILSVGIVPLGFTSYQSAFDRSFDQPAAARAVIDEVRPFQMRAMRERGSAWAFAADEFFRNAYPDDMLAHLPDASFYGDFGMFEDGIGIIRSYVDDWRCACESGLAMRAAKALDEAGAVARMVVGGAMEPFLSQLIERSPLAGRLVPLVVRNRFFGGNVNVTGLLVGGDIACAVAEAGEKASRAEGGPASNPVFLVLSVVLNDDGLLLDGMTMEDVSMQAACPVHVVSCNPTEYLPEIIALLARAC